MSTQRSPHLCLSSRNAYGCRPQLCDHLPQISSTERPQVRSTAPPPNGSPPPPAMLSLNFTKKSVFHASSLVTESYSKSLSVNSSTSPLSKANASCPINSPSLELAKRGSRLLY